jgi:hypothetical protein
VNLGTDGIPWNYTGVRQRRFAFEDKPFVYYSLDNGQAFWEQIAMNLRFVAVLFSIALLCSVSFAAEPTFAPKKLRAVIGGFLGSTYVVELRDGALRYTQKRGTSAGYGVISSATVTPTVQQWQEFRKFIDQLNIWQWRADYPSQGTQDGTQWSLEIAYADHALQTHGNNSYPDSSGKPNGKAIPTEAFNRYLAAIKKLIGDRSFE